MTDSTLLHRQVHPSFVVNGRVSSQAFRPTPKDSCLLSVCDGDQMTAEAAWLHYTRELGLASCGVLAVTNGECSTMGLPVIADGKPYKAHVSLDFTKFSNNQREKIAKRLRALAVERGWQYRPEADDG